MIKPDQDKNVSNAMGACFDFVLSNKESTERWCSTKSMITRIEITILLGTARSRKMLLRYVSDAALKFNDFWPGTRHHWAQTDRIHGRREFWDATRSVISRNPRLNTENCNETCFNKTSFLETPDRFLEIGNTFLEIGNVISRNREGAHRISRNQLFNF